MEKTPCFRALEAGKPYSVFLRKRLLNVGYSSSDSRTPHYTPKEMA